MRLIRLFQTCALAGALALAATGMAVAGPLTSLSIAAVGNKDVGFQPGGLFHVDADPAATGFTVSGTTGGSGALVGLGGRITGLYAFADPEGSPQVPVSGGPGAFVLEDGTGNIFSAPVSFSMLLEYQGPFAGLMGEIDFSAATYGGANTDLLALAGTGRAPLSITFHITPGPLDLDVLYDAPRRLTERGMSTYVGLVSVVQQPPGQELSVPEPGTAALLGVGLLGIGFAGRRRALSRSVPTRTSGR